MAFQYGFAWQTFGVLREGKTSLCSQCQIHFGHLPKTPLENPNRNETLHFRKIDFCSMHQQFCMVASITNFSDKKRYLPSAALSFFCLTCGKIQSVSSCSFLTEFVQENTFISFSEQKEDSILGWEMARGGNSTSGNWMWPFLGLTPVITITYTASGLTRLSICDPDI